MKKTTGLLLIAGIFLLGCQVEGDKEVEKEGSAYQMLLEESAMRDSAMLELMVTLNLIDENISKISDRQNEIDINANDVEFRQTYRERMLDDIQDIFEMMESNKNRISDLNARLADARKKLGSANKENERLVKLLDQYQVMINNLNTKLESKDQEIYELNEKLAMMDISLDSLKAEVEAKHTEMNKVYYAFGTKKELMYHNIIDKSGGFIGIGKSYQLKDDFNKEYFTMADAESLTKIELYVKEANVLSTHSEKSYHFEGEDNVESLIIDNPELFWGSIQVFSDRGKSMKSESLVIGASLKAHRYSNMAINRLRSYGHSVKAIGLREGFVQDVPIEKGHPEFTNIDTVTLYINPRRQPEYFDYITSLGPRRVIFNPGTENSELEHHLESKGIEAIRACTLVMLTAGQY